MTVSAFRLLRITWTEDARGLDNVLIAPTLMLFSGMTYPIYLGFGKQQLAVRNVIETSIPLAKVMGRTL